MSLSPRDQRRAGERETQRERLGEVKTWTGIILVSFLQTQVPGYREAGSRRFH
jgi:hypothetical protein